MNVQTDTAPTLNTSKKQSNGKFAQATSNDKQRSQEWTGFFPAPSTLITVVNKYTKERAHSDPSASTSWHTYAVSVGSRQGLTATDGAQRADGKTGAEVVRS